MRMYYRIKGFINKRIEERRKRIEEQIEERRMMELIRESGLFDAGWYLAKNPDIPEAQADPLLHYLRYGGFEGRDPGPLFCSRWYLNSYEDVRSSGLNPLVHYLEEGRAKGHQPQSVVISYINATFCATHEAYISRYYPHRSESPKVFCIGHNKTGTTSLEAVLKNFGYKIGDQWDAEILLGDWVMRDFRRIIEYCKTADAFQDVPFSLDYTYQALDNVFPNAKFILTVRNNADEWYESVVRFYKKIIGVSSELIPEQLKQYQGGNDRGWLWRFQQYVYGATEETLFDKNLYKAYYENHNAQIVEYFKYRPDDLLVLNLSDPSAMRALCKFLGVKYTGQVMPHLNKSKE